jgi:hypothetical protein
VNLRIVSRVILAWGIALGAVLGCGVYDSFRSYSDMGERDNVTPPWGVAPSLAVAFLVATAVTALAAGIAHTVASCAEEE